MKIVLEEIVSQEFEVPDNWNEGDIRNAYRNTEIVMDNANLTELNVLMNENEGWVKLL